MKSMCRRRPTGAALAIVAAVAHQASAFVAPSASTSTLPLASRLHASVEDATTTTTDGNAVSTEKAAETAISENPRKSGLALMLDDGELYAYPDGGDGAELIAAEAAAFATSFSDVDDENNNERRRTMVEIPSEIMYHGNLVVHTPLKKTARKKGRRGLWRRLLSRIRAS